MSWQMRAVGVFLRATRKRRFARAEGGAAMLGRAKGPSQPPAGVLSDLAVHSERRHGFEVYVVRRPDIVADGQGPVVIYLHGGAYVGEIVRQHWQLVATLATELEAEVWVPIYGLAPEHDALEALAHTTGLVRDLRGAGQLGYLVGDSAGAGLALLTAQQSTGSAEATLTGLTLMSPWLDLTLANPEIDRVEPDDPWLARAALHPVADAWAGDVPRDDPRVSPLFGPMCDLPPVDLWVGTRDITWPDTRLLHDRLRDHGEVDLHEVAGALHVFPLLPVPEGRAARTAIVAQVRSRLAGGR